MVRELAGFDPDRAQVILRWPLREACLCYVERLKREAMIEYRHQAMLWASIAPHSTKKTDPPRLPTILRPDAKADEHGR
jgi:hypothetical protein